jgi:hypothetical protein
MEGESLRMTTCHHNTRGEVRLSGAGSEVRASLHFIISQAGIFGGGKNRTRPSSVTTRPIGSRR